MSRPRLVAAALVPVAVLLVLLRDVLPTLGTGMWGPADPWLNGDLNGGWWLWWALTTDEPWTLLGWPTGVHALAPVIPNPLDMQLYALLLGEPTVLAWNLVQLGHLLALVVAAYALAVTAGATPLAAATGASLLAASPVLLHEIAGGRPSSLVAWPGVLALLFLVRGRSWRDGVAAGAFAALQGVAYAWHGLALIVVGLPLVRNLRVTAVAAGIGAALVAPYLAWLLDGLGDVPQDRPAAGYTALPLAGLWGEGGVPARFRVHPLLFPAALLGLRGGARFLVAGVLGLLLAIGPAPTWDLGDPVAVGPWAWVAWLLPEAARLHHPVRATLLVLPVLAVALALGVDRFRWRRLTAGLLLVASGWTAQGMFEATTFAQSPEIPGADTSLDGPTVDLLGMRGRTALSLQTVHGQPVMEPLWFRRDLDPLQRRVTAVAEGGLPDERLVRDLAAAGFENVLVLDRFGDRPEVSLAVEQVLGSPDQPGVWRLE